MQALILAGGQGTRLQPLTSTIPKPVVPIVDRPFMQYMIEWLRDNGVTSIIISSGHMASEVRQILGGRVAGLAIRYVEEPMLLGTGGAIKYAEQFLDERFFVLNGDVLTDIDLRGQLDLHQRVGAAATLALTSVSDPSNYGLVTTADDGAVTAFIEKPTSGSAVDPNAGNNISAGAYVLEREVLNVFTYNVPASIERDLFPTLVGNGLYARVVEGYWLDIGTPERYLQASFDIVSGVMLSDVGRLTGNRHSYVAKSASCSGELNGSVFLDSNSTALSGSNLTDVVLGKNVTVGNGSRLERSVVLAGSTIGSHCVLHNCIVGPNATIKDRVSIGEFAMIGAGATIASGVELAPLTKVLPTELVETVSTN